MTTGTVISGYSSDGAAGVRWMDSLAALAYSRLPRHALFTTPHSEYPSFGGPFDMIARPLGCDASALRTSKQRIDNLKHVSVHYTVTILYLAAGYIDPCWSRCDISLTPLMNPGIKRCRI
jgi:hypothetical protein